MLIGATGMTRIPMAVQAAAPPEAPRDCPLCPRLVLFREANQAAEPRWFNGAVPSFGDANARLLIVGLAPGLRGANRTGRPFTGDHAGDLLYATLLEFGFAMGCYEARPGDGLTLADCMITNAVRCVPPANKPAPVEVRTCQSFLAARIASLPRLRAIIALGRVAHDSTLAALSLRKSAFPFAHGAAHSVRVHAAGERLMALHDSYHCSRYNTNTGVLTASMFRSVFSNVREALGDER